MLIEREKNIKNTFPKLFPEHFFFECGDGWLELIIDAANYITQHCNSCKIVQVKEKFGTLRIYVDFDSHYDGTFICSPDTMKQIYDYLWDLEKKSISICEDCGTELNEKTREPQEKLGYWIRNICHGCAKKEKRWRKKLNESDK